MPADPSIYGMIRNPQFEGPIDQYAKAATLRNLINAGELGGLQLKQTRRAMSDDEAVREAYRASGGDPAKLRELLYGAGQPQAAMAAEKAGLEMRGTAANVSKDEAETRLKMAQWGRDLIAQATPANYPQIIELGRQNGQQWAMNAPPQFDPAWQRNHVMKADDWIARNVPRGTIQDLGGSTQLVNPYTGAPMSQATPKTLAPGDAIAQQRLDLARRQAAYEGVPGAMPGGPQGVPAPAPVPAVAGAAPGAPAASTQPGLTPKQQNELALEQAKKNADIPKTLNAYVAARNGLVEGLRGSTTGPAAGRIPAVTSGQQIAEGGVAAMAPVLKQLFRVAGEGVFTDRDQQLLLDMVPKRTDTPAAREAKIANIDRIVSAKLGVEVPPLPPIPKPQGKAKVGIKFLGFE